MGLLKNNIFSFFACNPSPGSIAFAAYPRGTSSRARVVEWQTRMFEGHVGQPVGVRVPPRAPFFRHPSGCLFSWQKRCACGASRGEGGGGGLATTGGGPRVPLQDGGNPMPPRGIGARAARPRLSSPALRPSPPRVSAPNSGSAGDRSSGRLLPRVSASPFFPSLSFCATPLWLPFHPRRPHFALRASARRRSLAGRPPCRPIPLIPAIPFIPKAKTPPPGGVFQQPLSRPVLSS